MTRNKKYNDEEYFRQVMAELQPGADEYDRLMAARPKKVAMTPRRPVAWYAAAACLALVLVGSLTLYIYNSGAPEATPIARETKQPDTQGVTKLEKEDALLTNPLLEDELETTPSTFVARESNAKNEENEETTATPAVTSSMQLAEAIPQKTVEDATPAENDTQPAREFTEADAMLYLAHLLKEEDEKEQAIYKQILNELAQQSNTPELSI